LPSATRLALGKENFKQKIIKNFAECHPGRRSAKKFKKINKNFAECHPGWR